MAKTALLKIELPFLGYYVQRSDERNEEWSFFVENENLYWEKFPCPSVCLFVRLSVCLSGELLFQELMNFDAVFCIMSPKYPSCANSKGNFDTPNGGSGNYAN